MSGSKRIDYQGKTYLVRFISAGFGSSDYAIVQTGGGHAEIRVRIFDNRTMDGWWRMTEYEAESILREYFRLERDEYLEFCREHRMNPNDAGDNWESLYRIV